MKTLTLFRKIDLLFTGIGFAIKAVGTVLYRMFIATLVAIMTALLVDYVLGGGVISSHLHAVLQIEYWKFIEYIRR